MQNFVYKTGAQLPETIFGKEYSDGYGTLSFNISDSDKKRDYPILFHIYIDVSGSMSDIIDFKRNRSKMQLLKHTLKNILMHLAENSEHVYIEVKGFDNVIHDYINYVKVTKENISELLAKVEPIQPMNSTNIGLALTSLNRDLDKHHDNIELKNRVAIMLTDGDPTDGECSTTKLVDMVTKECSYHFIGLGNDHNGILMHELGHKNIFTKNWYINDIEHTGDVYGEILFNETHCMYHDNIITVTDGGKIYDYIKGEFVDTIAIGTLYEETIKNYHILINDIEKLEITIDGKQLDNTEFSIKAEQASYEPLEIEKQYLRLCVQKLMFMVRQDATKIENDQTIFEPMYLHKYRPKINIRANLDVQIKKDIDMLYDTIKTFIKENNLEKDDFMEGLFKDVNVMKNSYGTVDSFKIVSGREDSQGRQTAYNTASQYEDDYLQLLPPKLQREGSSAYRTPRRCDMMRNISNNIDNDDNDDDDNTSPIPRVRARLGLLSPPNTPVLQRQTTGFVEEEDEYLTEI
jgi:uncharacterized protein YegL